MNGKTLMILWSIVIFLFPGFQVCDASPLENDVELGRPKGEYYVHFGSDPVNLKNGNLYYPTTDLFIPCVGFPLSVTRSYNSRSLYTGIFGFGWSSNLDIRVEIEKYKVVMMEADGFRETFTFFQQKGGIRRFRSSAETKTVEIQNNKITMINRQTGERRMFDDKGKILERADKYGNTLTYQYNDEGHLTQVIDTAGRAIEILTDPTGKVNQITDPIQRMIHYEYDAKDNLIGVTDRAGHQTRFSYDKLHNLLRIDYPNGGSTKLSYDLRRDLIIKELGPERRSTSYRYKLDPKHPESWTVEVIDALNNTTRYDYSNNGYHLVITDALGGKIIKESCGECGGRLVSITDAGGNDTHYEYKTENGMRVVSRINPLGARSIQHFDIESDELLKEISADGAETEYTYDDFGNLVQARDMMGGLVKLHYDEQGLVTHKEDARGAVTKFQYDSFGNLTSIIDPMGYKTAFVFDQLSRPMLITDANGNVTKFEYTPNDNIASTADALGNQTRFTYNPSGDVTKIDHNDVTLWSFHYDTAGDLTRIMDALGHTNKLEYDPHGRRVAFNNSRGFSWRYRYDVLGREVEVIDPLGHSKQMDYDPVGNLVRQQEPGGDTTGFQYDALNRLSKMTNALGRSTTYSYDTNDNLIEIRDQGVVYGSFKYDRLDRLIRRIDRIGREARYEYDANGNLVGQWNSMGRKTSYRYDLIGRISAIVSPEGQTESFKYDGVSNLIKTIDALGRSRDFVYDARNQLVQVSDYDQQLTAYERDARGNPVKLAIQNGPSVHLSYDAANRIVEVTGSGHRSGTYTYDEESNLIVSTDIRGRKKRFTYDGLDRLKGIEDADGSKRSFEYDAAGNLVRWGNQETEVWAEYGRMQTLTSVRYTKPDIALQMGYDPRGNLSKISLPNGQAVNYSYDHADRLKHIGLSNGPWVSLAYDKLGRVRQRDYSSGLSQHLSYTASGKIASITVGMANQNPLATRSYGYDSTDNLIKEVSDDQQFNYAYDKDRLTHADLGQWGAFSWAYDERSRRIQTEHGGHKVPYEYSSRGQLVRAGTESFEWDDSGNLVKRKNDSRELLLQYDDKDRLRGARATPGEAVSYGYDALGRLTRRTTASQTDYMVELEGTIRLIVGDNSKVKEVFFYEDIDRPILSSKGQTTLFLHQDILNNVFLVTDLKGKAYDRRVYSPFGRILAGNLRPMEPGYDGRPFDPLTALCDMRFRQYAPRLGIFTTPDPLFDSEPYVFAKNNPLKFHDHLGLSVSLRELQDDCKDREKNVVNLEAAVQAAEKMIAGVKGGESVSDLERIIKKKDLLRFNFWTYYLPRLKFDRFMLGYTRYGEMASYTSAFVFGALGGLALSSPPNRLFSGIFIPVAGYYTVRASELEQTRLKASRIKERLNKFIMKVEKRISSLKAELYQIKQLITLKRELEQAKVGLAACEKKLAVCMEWERKFEVLDRYRKLGLPPPSRRR